MLWLKAVLRSTPNRRHYLDTRHLEVPEFLFVTIEIGNLVKKNIVEKRPNPDDRRSMFLGLTRKGRSLLRELAAVMRKGNDIHFRSLTEERARLLQEMISTLVTDGMSSLREVYGPLLEGQIAEAQTDVKLPREAKHQIVRRTPGLDG